MSFTLTSTAEETSKFYLTPPKRLRLTDETRVHTSSVKALHSWTFSAESIASCTIHDVLSMRKNIVDDCDFFWLGRVPCRSVKIVGVIVGIQVYERKITYTVDDGTGVIDCVHLHRPAKPTMIKYIPIDTETTTESFYPVTEIGQTIRVTGVVRLQYHTRVISINEINQCTSPNEELLHSRHVRELRRNNYSSKEPFVIPERAEKPPYDTPITKTTLNSPITIPDPPSSLPSTPAKSSPIKDHETEVISTSPPKLRHPSRLHTQDLTENTFRIYVKHYMDHATNALDYDPDIILQTSLANFPTTPTKRSRVVSLLHTPRQSSHCDSSTTSKGSINLPQKSTERANHGGFTISCLRRVPELALLAYRVVHAVANRREREKRKLSKAIASSSKPSLPSSVPAIPPDKLAGKMKRLFEWAIIQLLQEGCIILWDGPARPLPDSKSMTTLWKTKPKYTPTSFADVKSFGSNSRYLHNETMSGYISDPQLNEESYIPLTPSYLSEHVIQAIQFLVELQADSRKPYAGATAEDVLRILKKDDRWRNIGLWNIQDALEILKAQGAVWDMGKGGWDLTE